jgi:F-type H+-transporting ATPase subunit epsilon
MANFFNLEIVTPHGVEFHGEVESVTCPGQQGRFQVLFNHAPFLSSLDIGIMNVVDAEGKELTYALSGGISQMFHNQMRILADSAERSENIDLDRAQDAVRRAEERLKQRAEDTDQDRARISLMRAVNRLKAAGRA